MHLRLLGLAFLFLSGTCFAETVVRCPVDCEPIDANDESVQSILREYYTITPVGGTITIRDREFSQDGRYQYAVWRRINGGWERTENAGWAVLAGGGGDDNWQLFPSYDVFNGFGVSIIRWEVTVGDIYAP